MSGDVGGKVPAYRGGWYWRPRELWVQHPRYTALPPLDRIVLDALIDRAWFDKRPRWVRGFLVTRGHTVVPGYREIARRIRRPIESVRRALLRLEGDAFDVVSEGPDRNSPRLVRFDPWVAGVLWPDTVSEGSLRTQSVTGAPLCRHGVPHGAGTGCPTSEAQKRSVEETPEENKPEGSRARAREARRNGRTA